MTDKELLAAKNKAWREANKEALKEKLIHEDLERQGAQQIQDVTDKYVAEVDRISEEKQKEVMEF